MGSSIHLPVCMASTCKASASCLPPSYSPSTPSPPYTCGPSEEEQRLDYVAQASSSQTPEGVFTTTARRISVVLRYQEDGVDTPVYVRNALVSGEIRLEESDLVSISVQLEGQQTMSVAELSPSTHVLFSQKHVLWKRKCQEASPRTVDFHLPFPSTFELRGTEHVLPPTFEASFPDSPGLSVNIFYTLTVKITRPRLGTWKQHKLVVIPIRYHPRSRPFLPISPDLYPFLSTIKTAPEAWSQVTSVMSPCESSFQPVDCHLFIPSVQIFGLTDKIPFHLQLRGSSNSLSALVGLRTRSKSLPAPLQAKYRARRNRAGEPSVSSPPEPMRMCDYAAQNPWSLQSPYVMVGGKPEDLLSLASARVRDRDRQRGKLSVRVYVLRQVATKVKGQRAWRNRVLAEGVLRAVGEPPQFGESDETCSLDWEGEIVFPERDTVASFIAGELQVKDFVVVQVNPSDPLDSPFVEHEHSHSIRLVTDSYRDVGEHPANR